MCTDLSEQQKVCHQQPSPPPNQLNKIHILSPIYTLTTLHHYTMKALPTELTMSTSISRVRDLTAPMHLGLKAGPLCPMSNQESPEALLKLQMAHTLNVLRLQEKRAQIRKSERGQKPHIHKEYGPRFPPSPHISYTMDCPAVLEGRDAASGCYDQ